MRWLSFCFSYEVCMYKIPFWFLSSALVATWILQDDKNVTSVVHPNQEMQEDLEVEEVSALIWCQCWRKTEKTLETVNKKMTEEKLLIIVGSLLISSCLADFVVTVCRSWKQRWLWWWQRWWLQRTWRRFPWGRPWRLRRWWRRRRIRRWLQNGRTVG